MPGRRCLSGNFGGTDEYEILGGMMVMRQNRGPQLGRKRSCYAGAGCGLRRRDAITRQEGQRVRGGSRFKLRG